MTRVTRNNNYLNDYTDLLVKKINKSIHKDMMLGEKQANLYARKTLAQKWGGYQRWPQIEETWDESRCSVQCRHFLYNASIVQSAIVFQMDNAQPKHYEDMQ